MKTKPPSNRRTISAREAAERIGKTPMTIRNWCRKMNIGKFVTIPGSETGYYLLSEAEVERMSDPENQPKIGRRPGNSRK